MCRHRVTWPITCPRVRGVGAPVGRIFKIHFNVLVALSPHYYYENDRHKDRFCGYHLFSSNITPPDAMTRWCDYNH